MSSDLTLGNFSPCPGCGKRCRRVYKREREVIHIALGHTVLIRIRVGVYKTRCGCVLDGDPVKYFTSPVPGIPVRGKYTLEVRNTVANALIRDRLPNRMVQTRMREDFGLDLSLGYIHDCFRWAHEQIHTEEYRRWAVENVSGVLCIDEVHDGGKVLLFATDPLGDFTVHFAINEKNDQEHMDAFLKEIRDMGIVPEVVITDGSPLYKDALQEVWEGVEHQLCIFHAVKEVNKLVLDALRSIKNRIKRQGNKGRRKKRGRKKKGARKTTKETKKDQAKFLWENQHLIVRRGETMTRDDHRTLRQMYQIDPQIKTLRRFVKEFYRLFARGITKQQARNRRTRMIHNEEYQKNSFLKRALKKLRKERFEKMIVFLGHGEDAERTSNHVERNNRSFRMLQKTRYCRREIRTIRMMIELDLYARMLRHVLFKPDARVPLSDLQEPRKEAA